MKTHELKLNIEFCDAVLNGEKTFEIRYNDRGYQKGDLIKFVPVEGALSSKTAHDISEKIYEITYVLSNWGLKEGYVVLGIMLFKPNTVCEYCINYDICSACNSQMDDCVMFKDKSHYIKLPCKVGDTVYYIKTMFSFMPVPKEEKVRKIEIIEGELIFRTETRTFNEKAINDTVFLDKGSAENALREREEK